MDSDIFEDAAKKIHIFFRDPQEEARAVQVARALAHQLPDHVAALRPETTLAEIFRWATVSGVETISFVTVFERALGFELDELGDGFEGATFRELIEHGARR